MITHLGFRIALGLHVLLVGIVLLLVHANRKRSNLGGRFFRLGGEIQERMPARRQAMVYLVLGWLSVIAALIVLLVGVRPTL